MNNEGYTPMSSENAHSAAEDTAKLIKHGAQMKEGGLEVTGEQLETARVEMEGEQLASKIKEVLEAAEVVDPTRRKGVLQYLVEHMPENDSSLVYQLHHNLFYKSRDPEPGTDMQLESARIETEGAQITRKLRELLAAAEAIEPALSKRVANRVAQLMPVGDRGLGLALSVGILSPEPKRMEEFISEYKQREGRTK